MSTRCMCCVCARVNIYIKARGGGGGGGQKKKKWSSELGFVGRSGREREGRPELKAFVCSFQTDLAGTPALRRLGRGCGRVSAVMSWGFFSPTKRTVDSARSKGSHTRLNPPRANKHARRSDVPRSFDFGSPRLCALRSPLRCGAVGTSRLSWNGANSFPWKPTSYNSVHFGL